MPSPDRIQRSHIDGVFVGSEDDDVEQRGSLVGIKAHQYRQVLALMTAAGLCEDVLVQVLRNEGGLSLRISSAPDVAGPRARTSKSISPVQVESDAAAYGSREDKIRSASLQRAAWDGNAAYLSPVWLGVRYPLPLEERGRGCIRTPESQEWTGIAPLMTPEDLEAEEAFVQAVSARGRAFARSTRAQ